MGGLWCLWHGFSHSIPSISRLPKSWATWWSCGAVMWQSMACNTRTRPRWIRNHWDQHRTSKIPKKSRIVRHRISWLLCWCMQNDILSINCFLYTVIDWIQASSILSNVRQTQLLFIVEACQFPSNQAPRRDDMVNLFPVVLWLLGRPLGFTISYYLLYPTISIHLVPIKMVD